MRILKFGPEGCKRFWVEVLNHGEFYIAPAVRAAVLTHLEPLQHAVSMESVPANRLLYNSVLFFITGNANTAQIIARQIFLLPKFGAKLFFQYLVLIRVQLPGKVFNLQIPDKLHLINFPRIQPLDFL
jgi:hypothetical protein